MGCSSLLQAVTHPEKQFNHHQLQIRRPSFFVKPLPPPSTVSAGGDRPVVESSAGDVPSFTNFSLSELKSATDGFSSDIIVSESGEKAPNLVYKDCLSRVLRRPGSRFGWDLIIVQEQLEIKFRLHDGLDIGPNKYPAATTFATLKESILAKWPKGGGNRKGK